MMHSIGLVLSGLFALTTLFVYANATPNCPPCECTNPLRFFTDRNGCRRCWCFRIPQGPGRPRKPDGDCPYCPCKIDLAGPVDANGCPACSCLATEPPAPPSPPGPPSPPSPPVICPDCECAKPIAPPSIDKNGCLRCSCPEDGIKPPLPPPTNSFCPFNQIEVECALDCQPNCNDYVRKIDTMSLPCNKMCRRCVCEDGLYFESDGHCIAPEFCGCYEDRLDQYFKVGDRFLIDDQICECDSLNNILCEEDSEGSGSGIEV
ncbi:IgGFc-binding protein-like [Anneissia japonica]|uniref:IgGFc-binding protein-like n=1 Tax=Anneissia japonica TaxID=1529436 RepID=UPI00142576C8|nr:IgGFc-binding protein-like [Anneissia japonica]